MPDAQLTKIPGIGPATAQNLATAGFSTVDAIAQAQAADLAQVNGFGQVRAAVVIGAAQAMLSATDAAPVATKPETKDKKAKKKKKGKKKDKKPKKKGDKKKRQGKKKDKKKDKKKGKKKGKK